MSDDVRCVEVTRCRGVMSDVFSSHTRFNGKNERKRRDMMVDDGYKNPKELQDIGQKEIRSALQSKVLEG